MKKTVLLLSLLLVFTGMTAGLSIDLDINIFGSGEDSDPDNESQNSSDSNKESNPLQEGRSENVEQQDDIEHSGGNMDDDSISGGSDEGFLQSIISSIGSIL